MQQAVAAGAGDLLRRGIGPARIVEPQIVFEHRQQLRGEEAALGLQMPRALAAIARDIGGGGIEQQDRLRAHRAVLDAAEAERIDRSGGLGGCAV